MKNTATLVIAAWALVGGAASPVHARTLVWQNANANEFLDSSNWKISGTDESATPQSGDRLELSLSANIAVKSSTTFDIGAEGVTIYCNNSRKINFDTVVFSGTGALTLDGKAGYQFYSSESSYSGGTIMKSQGQLYSAAKNPFGTGTITLYRYNASRPYFGWSSGNNFTNQVVVVGKEGFEGSYYVGESKLGGGYFPPIEADCDISLGNLERGKSGHRQDKLWMSGSEDHYFHTRPKF